MDKRQDAFEHFEVPDPVRIDKSIRLIKKRFPDVRGLNVLECGVAKGGVADRLVREGAVCRGIDINPRQLEGVAIVQKDLNEGFPPFENKFDVIFAGEVMEHLYDDSKFLRECRASLAPGGVLTLTVPHLFFSVNRLRMLFGWMPLFAYAPYHYHFYSIATLRALLEEEGFRVRDLISSHILFSRRRNFLGGIFESLGNALPSLGAHLIVCAEQAP